jgi:DNA-binding response OmpR family regulator
MGQIYTLSLGVKSKHTIPRTLLRERFTVVIAHENATVLSCIVDAPALRGHRVRVAQDERTTYSLLAAEQVHLVLLDLHLITDNFVVHLLRQQKQRRVRPPYIIVLSDLSSETDRQHAYRIAADEYWPNLFNLPQLSLRITAVLQYLSRCDDEISEHRHRELRRRTMATLVAQPQPRQRPHFLHYWFRRETVRRALTVAGIVGPILTLINQYDVLLRGELSVRFWMKVLLTFLVPYCVSSFSSARAYMEHDARENALRGQPRSSHPTEHRH